MRAATGLWSLVVAFLVMSDPTAARATPVFSVGLDGDRERIGLVNWFDREVPGPQIPVFPSMVQIADEEQPLIAFSSKDWNKLIDKRRLARLIRPIARSFQSLDKWSTALSSARRTRRLGSSVERLRKPKVAAIAQVSPMEGEIVAISTPHASTDSSGEMVRATPASPSGRPPGPAPFGWLFWPSAIVAVILITGAIASRWRENPRSRRERARSDQVIVDAIGKLSQVDVAFRTDVQKVLKQIEEVYGLKSATIALISPETWQIEDIYVSEVRAFPPDPFLEECVAEIRGGCEELCDRIVWRQSAFAPPPSKTFGWWTNRLKPHAVASVVWLGDRQGVMLAAQCLTNRRAWPTDNDTLQLATHLLAVAIGSNSHLDAITASSHVAYLSAGGAADLVGRVAHEFNNVLTSIAGYAEMTADSLQPGSSPRKYVEHIQKSAKRAKRVVDQILEYSRGRSVAHELFDVGAAIAEILPDVQMFIPASTVVYAELPDRPIQIHGNPIDLQQAVINLCKNASEALLEGGTVTLSVAAVDQPVPRAMIHGRLVPGRYVRVSVRDNGPGLAEVDLARIFDSFFTTKSLKGGTGLGLSTVDRAVQLLDGAMDVRSKLGFGTQFDLFFPQVIATTPKHLSAARVERELSGKDLEPFVLADTPHGVVTLTGMGLPA